MNENVGDSDFLQLSQESCASTQSLDVTTGTIDDKQSKKKKEGKKSKKKKPKSKDSSKSEKHKKKLKSSRRPDPEGGNSSVNDMDEYDRVIYSNEPIFSDLELSDEESKSTKPCRPPRPARQTREGVIIPCFQLGINCNTMIKLAIIGTELQNVLRVSMKRVCLITCVNIYTPRLWL